MVNEVTLRHDDVEGAELLQSHLISQPGGVLLVSTQPAILDTFARGFVQSLRGRAGDARLQVSVLIEMSREFLLERFERGLKGLTIEEARRINGARNVPHVWVLHAQTQEQIEQTRLVMRLATEFPGANIRLLVLAGVSADQLLRQTDEGRHMLRCLVLPVENARRPEDAISEAIGEAASFGAIVTSGDVSQKVSSGERPDSAAGPPMSMTADATKARTSRKLLPLLGVAVLLLVVSLLLVFMMQPRTFLSHVSEIPPREGPTSSASSPAVSNSLPEPPQPVTTPVSSAEKSVPEQPAALDGPASASSATTAGRLPSLDGGGERAAEAAPLVNPDPTVRAAAALTAESRMAVERDTRFKITADESVKEAREWVLGLVPGQWVVHHANFPSFQDARRWRDRSPELRNARIVQLLKRGEDRPDFGVISGPFESREEASQFAQSRPTDKFRIRGVSSIQRDLAERSNPR